MLKARSDIKNGPVSNEELVKQLITRDLFHLKWDLSQLGNNFIIKPPENYDKNVVRASMELKRNEALDKNKDWIDANLHLLKANLADGRDVLESKIIPHIEVCENQKQHDLFRLCRYYWSSPYSDYVGRRIKLLIRDVGLPNNPIIGIAALGSPIIHIPERDDFIGWDTKTRTDKLIYSMDAYVLGAMPPYNYLLGGKLVSYILASNEVRSLYKNKYKDVITHINKRTASDLVCIFTTSLYGRSSQYNRLKYNDNILYQAIGKTKGYGSLHLSDETFAAMQKFLSEKKFIVTNKFGDGPIWRMRVIRSVCDMLKIDANILLNHSFKRNIYCVPLASNFKEFLLGQDLEPNYYDYPLNELVDFWKTRWFKKRQEHLEKNNDTRLRLFQASKFMINREFDSI